MEQIEGSWRRGKSGALSRLARKATLLSQIYRWRICTQAVSRLGDEWKRLSEAARNKSRIIGTNNLSTSGLCSQRKMKGSVSVPGCELATSEALAEGQATPSSSGSGVVLGPAA